MLFVDINYPCNNVKVLTGNHSINSVIVNIFIKELLRKGFNVSVTLNPFSFFNQKCNYIVGRLSESSKCLACDFTSIYYSGIKGV